jgi:DNA repair protein RadC
MTSDKPHFYGHRQRLREKFNKCGFVGMAEYEIVELILTLAIPRSDVKLPAKELIVRFGNLRGIMDAPIDELQRVEGIGPVTPVALRIIRETANLYLQQLAEQAECFSNNEALVRFWRAKIGALSSEIFQVGYLDSGYRLLRNGVETLEEGIADRATVYPRRVIEAALKKSAAVLVFAHNHPNGDVQP